MKLTSASFESDSKKWRTRDPAPLRTSRRLYVLAPGEFSRTAIDYLEQAYKENVKYAPDTGRTPNRMGASRLLALTKGFIEYLETRKNWETEQLRLPHGPIVIRTLLAVYDRTLAHILDLEGHTYQSFFAEIQEKSHSIRD